MLSTAGRIFEKKKTIKPLSKSQRIKVYRSCQVKVNSIKPHHKFSPFNTVSRTQRDSYLLRVTNQPIVNTNYQINHNATLPLNRRPTIDHASFTRIIGDVKDKDYSKPTTPETSKKCIRALSLNEKYIPLTSKDIQKWRKNHLHLDFSKQPESTLQKQERLNSTFYSTFNSKQLKNTIQSNFNNYDRFKFKPYSSKAHLFDSDSGHQYLLNYQIPRLPQYDTLQCRQQIIRQSMAKPKGQPRFHLFKQKIATRFDRGDPQWMTMLQYNNQQNHNSKTISFDKTLNRKPNDIHSKYPIRLSLTKVLSKKDDQKVYQQE